eukprot:s352_g13.t1
MDGWKIGCLAQSVSDAGLALDSGKGQRGAGEGATNKDSGGHTMYMPSNTRPRSNFCENGRNVRQCSGLGEHIKCAHEVVARVAQIAAVDRAVCSFFLDTPFCPPAAKSLGRLPGVLSSALKPFVASVKTAPRVCGGHGLEHRSGSKQQ